MRAPLDLFDAHVALALVLCPRLAEPGMLIHCRALALYAWRRLRWN